MPELSEAQELSAKLGSKASARRFFCPENQELPLEGRWSNESIHDPASQCSGRSPAQKPAPKQVGYKVRECKPIAESSRTKTIENMSARISHSQPVKERAASRGLEKTTGHSS